MQAFPFQLAIILENEYVPAWQYRLLQQLLPLVQGNCAVVLCPPAANATSPLMAGVLAGLRKLDAKLFAAPLTALKRVSALPLLGDVPILRCGSKRFRQWLASDALDLVVDLGRGRVDQGLLAHSRYGVWQYFFGDVSTHHDAEVGVWEYREGKAEILAGLLCRRAGENVPQLLWYATTSTDQGSLNRGGERTLWKMAEAVPQCLQRLQQAGWAALLQRVAVDHVTWREWPVRRREASWFGIGGLVWRYLRNVGGKFYFKLFCREQWMLLVRWGQGDVLDGKQLCQLEAFQRLMPPHDRFWADPFLVAQHGRTYVFFEEWVYAKGRGHVACMELHPDGSHSPPQAVLERPYHLSYPFVFQYQGEWYMIPETAANHTVELYRCEQFPHRWVWVQTLLSGVEAYDATLLEYQGKWWMFVSMRHHPHCSPSELLYLFYADTPLANTWVAHPNNPVVTEAARARPAGRLFVRDGKLYRPSQNCAGSYGRGLNLNWVKQLDENNYSEIVLGQCLPEGRCHLHGVHTLDSTQGLTVMDAVYVHRPWHVFKRWGAKRA